MQSLTILGATGSIGVSTLDVVARHPERYRIFALTGQTQLPRLAAQCSRFQARYAVVGDAASAAQLASLLRDLGASTEVLHGPAQLAAVAEASEVDVVMAAIVGAAGLRPTLAAARAGKRVLLANKEALVMSGALFMAAVEAGGATLLPIDSEHNAVFQALPPTYRRDPDAVGVRRILLTASGGPFRDRAIESLVSVSPEEACAHPNWAMGRKISVDSATMMNKGLEVIEAHWLFGVPADRIEVVVHRQSVIHSMVDYVDGSVLAQLGNPDMRTPIAHALAFPERIDAGVSPLDLFATGRLDFEQPDPRRFPCLPLAYAALRAGRGVPAAMNAANEVAVDAFLAGRLAYLSIARVVESVMNAMAGAGDASLEELESVDAEARALAQSWVHAEKVA
ncbi:1-deoxy-D-xylulose-5-phosphate reductoisomerase [Denitromonas iodatirespirans]|uniref:1-deoxy-D-xylulose 5-phosphate reductoisomerase n=1 Tax=Denitromonas iodatirespirans TaxID=2795389 RepID=A0A944D584_DENI1|nr:1-deoxy-D-xylulose-5-phosphate reductoisomerase [Denitromonas iodatirespirans]MBT0960164.1 1-deoxy-D-xylulose-5-phosphate reductoisomerase [Denitromonas iodatirespirans]